jgi:O-antigen/teichoic acid export membrane protein
MSKDDVTKRKIKIPIHIVVASSAWISRLISAPVQLLSIRVLMDNLGLENYAVFALLTGLMGWFLIMDGGVAVSVQNYISEARAKNQPYNDLIATSGLLALILLSITVVILYFVAPYIAPLFLKNFLFLSEAEKTRLFFITGSLSIAAGVGCIIYKVWYAEQKGYLSNIVPAFAAIVGLAGLLLVKYAPAEDRLLLSLVAFIAPTALLPLAAMVVQQANQERKYLKGQIPEVARRILKRGFHFWLFAVITTAVLNVDYIVMSQFLAPHEIASYFIATKVFGLAFFVYNAILFAIWPIFSEALAKRDWNIVGRHLKSALIFGLVFMVISTLLLIWLMPVAVGLLAPNESIVIATEFIILLGIYQLIRVWTDTFSILLQSMNDLKPLWMAVPVQILISLGLQWELVQRFGMYGVILGLIGSYVLTVTWVLPLAVRNRHRLSLRVGN